MASSSRPLSMRRGAEIRVGLGIVRLEGHGPLTVGRRLSQLPLHSQNFAQIVECLGKVRLEAQGLLKAGRRLVQSCSCNAIPRLLCALA